MWLVIIGLVPAVVLAVVAVTSDPSRGAVVAAVVLVGITALPLWWRWHSGAFRLSAGLIGAALSIVALLAWGGGLLALPTGLLLLAAAVIPKRG